MPLEGRTRKRPRQATLVAGASEDDNDGGGRPNRKAEEEQQDTNREEGADFSKQQQPPDETDATVTDIPQVLTRAVIPTLAVARLDASDVLELYYLTRPTVWHAFPSVPVTKAALGLRYRPALSSVPDGQDASSGSSKSNSNNKPLELTLEYGAVRAGSDLAHESLPRVVADDDEEVSSVSWDNEARVYYTERILPSRYATANYLASLSGTVLERFLQSAVDLMEAAPGRHHRHRRYQPLAVALQWQQQPPPPDETGDGDNNDNDDDTTTSQQQPQSQQILLRSSSDVDFLQQLYRVLADLGVVLQPVILPVQTHIRLHAAAATGKGAKGAVQKVAVGVDVPPRVPAEFYQRLYDCVQAIARADSAAAGAAAGAGPNNNDAANDGATDNNNNNNSNATSNNDDDDDNDDQPPRRRLLHHPEGDVETKPPHVVEASPTAPPTTTATSTTIVPTASSSLDDGGGDGGVDETTEDAPEDNPNEDTVPDHTAVAQEAAAHAQEAASAADRAGTPQDAQAAAQEAATAAQEAASATAQQAARMAQQALQSGDAPQVAQTVARLCFAQQPQQQQQQQQQATAGSSNNTSLPAAAAVNNNVTAYIYWDGAFYYRVDLVPPYISIVTEPQVMPQPPVAGISREDFVDWAIFVLMAAGAAAGFLLLLQQICGLRIVPKLYKYQRWFFQPRHCSLDDDEEEDNYYNNGGGGGSASNQNRGEGKPFSFGADAIPLSMGGRRMATVFSNRDDARFFEQAENWLKGGGGNNSVGYHHADVDDYDENDFEESEHDNFLGSAGGDLELVPPPSSSQFSSNNSFGGRLHSAHSFHDGENEDAVSEHSSTLDGTPSRLFRDPNLVDLPDLKSRSKVAVPVSISYNNNNNNNNSILD